MEKEAIIKAIKILKGGGIVIFPTDTAFGIGCRMDDKKAVDRLFRIRKRPRIQATPVLVASMEIALTYYLNPQEIVRRLMKKYWPGSLTIIAKCKKNLVYSPIRGAGESIGLRMPNHETALEIIRGAGVPILGPSANFHGHPTPYRFEDLDSKLVRLVDYVVQGECFSGNVSTVVDCSIEPYRIVRQGAVFLKSTIITIDSSGSEAIIVVVETGEGKRFILKKQISQTKAQEVLPMIEKLLSDHKVALDDVASIRVFTGPGSYTGLRVGIAIANMLGFLLGVSINDLPVGSQALPVYEGDRW